MKKKYGKFVRILSAACIAVFLIGYGLMTNTERSLLPDAGNASGSKDILQQETLDMENPQDARALTEAVTVSLKTEGVLENRYGSGVIWDQTKEEILILTSAHLLQNAKEALLITFPAETITAVKGYTVGVSSEYDIGFVAFSKNVLKSEEAEQLRYVRLHQRTYDTLSEGDVCFAAGSDAEQVFGFSELKFAQAEFSDEEIGSGLFLLEGSCKPGMSGSGVFDGYGNFIGMAVASNEKQTLAVPMEAVNAAYREVLQKTRDTRDY